MRNNRYRQGQAIIQDVARRATTGSRTEVQINRSEITCRDLPFTKHYGSHRDTEQIYTAVLVCSLVLSSDNIVSESTRS